MTPTDDAIKALEILRSSAYGISIRDADEIDAHYETIRTALQLLRQQRAQEVDVEAKRWADMLDMAIASAVGTRATIHLTRAKQLRDFLRTAPLSTPHPSPETVTAMRDALDDAPIMSKYHMVQGFDQDRFVQDYHLWKHSARKALALYEADMKTAQEREKS